MRALIIKTSSMGDVIHTLPALTDAMTIFPNLKFDWVVENSFKDIPAWHPAVQNVFPVELRKWRKNPLNPSYIKEFKNFYHAVKLQHYDFIIDAQGLLKSAWLSMLAKGERHGYHFKTAREGLSAIFYQKKHITESNIHAVDKNRHLFAKVFKYSMPTNLPDYGIKRSNLMAIKPLYTDYIIFFHGTTWPTKHWPEKYWQDLASLVNPSTSHILLPWGNEEEKQRATRIAQGVPNAKVLPKMSLNDLVALIAGAKFIFAVDTGLGHLAAALSVPTLSIFGPTNSKLTGAYGKEQFHISADFPCAPCLKRECIYKKTYSTPPCYETVKPEKVFKLFQQITTGLTA